MPPLFDAPPDRGPRVDVHVHLHAEPLAVLDAICTRYGVGRGTAIERLIDEYAKDEGAPPSKREGRKNK